MTTSKTTSQSRSRARRTRGAPKQLAAVALPLALLAGCGDGSGSLDGDAATGGDASALTGGAFATGGAATGATGPGGTGGAAQLTGGGPPGATGGAPLGGAGSGGQTGGGGAPVHPTCPGAAADAYLGAPAVIPGTLQAEDFDPEGYSDSSPENEGAAYRLDEEVDVKVAGDGHAVGWMTAGEWLEYTVDVPVAGNYDVEVRAGAVEAGRTLSLSQCEVALGDAIAIPQIAAWGDFATTSAGPIYLEAGVQVIRVTVGASDYVDLDWLTFTPASGGGGTGGAGSGGAGTGGDATGGSATGGDASGGSATGGALPRFVGNITTGNSIDTGGRTFSTYWDQITPENAGKWGSVRPNAASGYNWAALDAIYDYTQEKGIIFKQHTFVWGSQQPSDAASLTEEDVREWMELFCERYPDTRLIDVVNEPPPHTTPAYANAIGGGTDTTWQWVINSFEWADEYCPNAILILNDYNNIEYGNQTDHFIDIANAVLDAGAPLDALGAQAHGLSGGISSATMEELLTRMHTQTGLPVYITEYDIDLNDDAAQLAKYQAHFEFFRETEWIPGVTVWGWIYGQTWVTHSGLIRDGSPRPAMTWLMDELGRPAP